MVLYLVIRSYLGMVTLFFGDIPMDHVKVGRLGPFPRVSKPVFLTSALLIITFIVLGVFLLNLPVRCSVFYKALLPINLVGFSLLSLMWL